jgi:hypothetical protein
MSPATKSEADTAEKQLQAPNKLLIKRIGETGRQVDMQERR